MLRCQVIIGAYIGVATCLGIGSDFDGLGNTIPVVPEVSQLVRLTRAMLAAGLSEEEIRNVWGDNLLRVMQRNIDRS